MKPDTEHGFEFEERFSRRIDGELKKGSGNKWYCRGDVGDQRFVWSLKSTRNKSFDLDVDDFHEVEDIALAPGGYGDVIPAMAISIKEADIELVAMRIEDFISLVEEKVKYIRQSKAEAKRDAAATGILRRDTE